MKKSFSSFFSLFGLLIIFFSSACSANNTPSPEQQALLDYMHLPLWRQMIENTRPEITIPVHFRDSNPNSLLSVESTTKRFELQEKKPAFENGWYVLADQYIDQNGGYRFAFKVWNSSNSEPEHSFQNLLAYNRHYWLVTATDGGNPEWAAYRSAVRACVEANEFGAYADCGQMVADRHWRDTAPTQVLSASEDFFTADLLIAPESIWQQQSLDRVVNTIETDGSSHPTALFKREIGSEGLSYLNPTQPITLIIVDPSWLSINDQESSLISYDAYVWKNYTVEIQNGEEVVTVVPTAFPEIKPSNSNLNPYVVLIHGFASSGVTLETAYNLVSYSCNYAKAKGAPATCK